MITIESWGAFWLSVHVVLAGIVLHLRLMAWARRTPFRWFGVPGSWARTTVRAAAVLYGAFLVFALVVEPNLSMAIRRTRQKRTMADVRSIGTAAAEYAVDHGGYPIAALRDGEVDDGRRLMSWSRGMPRLVTRVRNQLEPEYIKVLPTHDAWGSPLYYDSDGTHFAVLALAEGGTMEPVTWGTRGPGSSFREDFIFADGEFFKW